MGTVTVGAGASLAAGSLLAVGDTRNPGDCSTPGGIGTLVANGSVAADSVFVGSGGFVHGSGLISGDVTNCGDINPGNSPGKLTIDGDYHQDGGILHIEIAGLADGDFDVLDVLGRAIFGGGTMQFDFLDGFLPVIGDTIDFLHAGELLGLDNVMFSYVGAAPGFHFDIDADDGKLTFIALNDAKAAVPEPSVALLLLAGLAMLLVARRRPAR